MRKVFYAEVSLLQELPHPSIVNLYDYFETEELCVLILEHCSKGSAANIIRQDSKMNQEFVKRCIIQLFSALSYMHKQYIAHHDIKPSNFLFDDQFRLKLSDFGLAQKYEPGQHSSIKKGTLEYVSPEMIRNKSYDPFKADIWAAGVSLYKMSTGHSLFSGNDKEIIKDNILNHQKIYYINWIDPCIQKVIEHCLNPDPVKRVSAQEIMNQITPIRESFSASKILKKENVMKYRPKRTITKKITLMGCKNPILVKPNMFASQKRDLNSTVRTRGSL